MTRLKNLEVGWQSLLASSFTFAARRRGCPSHAATACRRCKRWKWHQPPPTHLRGGKATGKTNECATFPMRPGVTSPGEARRALAKAAPLRIGRSGWIGSAPFSTDALGPTPPRDARTSPSPYLPPSGASLGNTSRQRATWSLAQSPSATALRYPARTRPHQVTPPTCLSAPLPRDRSRLGRPCRDRSDGAAQVAGAC